MKKLLMALVITLVFSGIAYAVSDTKDCTISVNVPSDFALDLGASWIDFGTVEAGNSTTNKNLIITTRANTGKNWELNFSNTDMAEDTDPTKVIANSDCYIQFNKDVAATGTSPYSTTGNLPGTLGANLYTSGIGEIGTLYHTAVLSVYVPVSQPAGFYKSVITFTMVEK